MGQIGLAQNAFSTIAFLDLNVLVDIEFKSMYVTTY